MPERFEDKIKALIEQRVIEATKKQLTQKMLLIVRRLGNQIIAQSVFDNKLYDPWQLEEEDLIYEPTTIQIRDPEDWSTSERGFHFDGLKYGINLCITTLIYDGKVDELKATYNGYLVFGEIGGDLKAYAPFPAWENAIEMFYEAAVEMDKKKLLEEKTQKQEEKRQKIGNFWREFRRLWGY